MTVVSTDRTWSPLLEGRDRERALEIAFGIAGAVRHRRRASPPDVTRDASLSGGKAGQAILFDYAAAARPDAGWDEAAGEALGCAMDTLAGRLMNPFLYAGFSGVAWTLAHLAGRSLELESDRDLQEIDERLMEFVDHRPWRQHYDLIGGIVGLGVYALERLPAPGARELLERIVMRLEETAVDRPEGLAWWSAPRFIGAPAREKTPRGHFNTGLAHGVPGVIAVLGRVCAAGIGGSRARRLLDGAVSWLLDQRLPAGSSSIFPGYFSEESAPSGTRMAWCYGDPGVAAALMYAAVEVGESSWQRSATEIAVACARRRPGLSGAEDAALCHGTGGLAHIFNRMFQASGDEELARAARFWYGITLGMWKADRGGTGYEFHVWVEERQTLEWREEHSLLTGSVGVALALLAATTPVVPEWDRMLLVSIPPRMQQGGPRV